MLFLNLSCKMLLLVAVFVEAGFVIGGAAMYAAARHSDPLERKARRLKFATYFIITHFMILAASAGKPVFGVVAAALAAIGAVEIGKVTLQKRFSRAIIPVAACSCYFAASAGAVLFAWKALPSTAVYVYLIICVLDAYSQLTGQLIGRHALAPAISPNKTVEGAVGGALCAVVTAMVFRGFAGFGYRDAFGCGLLLSCAGILGDLLSSKYKRICGIKDYSTLLPGQGGVIDRFNSFFAAALVYYLLDLAR
jgi:phosphatidate cytidylyltransferase